MSRSPSTKVQTARDELAKQLRELRLDAGLMGRDIAERAGWHPSKSSRIENAVTPPSDADIRAWCAACGADDRAPDLISISRAASSLYLQWKRVQRAGLRRLQESYVSLYDQTRLFKVYCCHVIPGLLQTPGYAAAMLTHFSRFHRTTGDIGEAVAARMERSQVIHEPGHRFAILVEESVLYNVIGDTELMIAQLEHLIEAVSLPSISLGIIPSGRPRRMWTLEPFRIFDDERTNVELLAAALTVVAPGEVELYVRAFDELSGLATYGRDATALITTAMESIRNSRAIP